MSDITFLQNDESLIAAEVAEGKYILLDKDGSKLRCPCCVDTEALPSKLPEGAIIVWPEEWGEGTHWNEQWAGVRTVFVGEVCDEYVYSARKDIETWRRLFRERVTDSSQG